MGPDKLQYDSTGAGEMVRSHDGEVMGGFAAPGGGASVPPSAQGGHVPLGSQEVGSDVRTIDSATGGAVVGYMAEPGGAQEI